MLAGDAAITSATATDMRLFLVENIVVLIPFLVPICVNSLRRHASAMRRKDVDPLQAMGLPPVPGRKA